MTWAGHYTPVERPDMSHVFVHMVVNAKAAKTQRALIKPPGN